MSRGLARLPRITRANVGRALLVGYLCFLVLYLGSFQLSHQRARVLAPSALDLYIPESAASIWVYLSQFILLPATLLSEADEQHLTRAYYAMLGATIASALVFVIWPTTVGQTMSAGETSLAIVWRWLYFFDVPGNCFPSLHVALSLIACSLLARRGTLWRVLAPVWWLAIALSTLTTRQHRLLDVAGGFAVGCLAWLITRQLALRRC